MQVIWRPQKGPQAALVKCPVDEIFFGGARGGGKTDGVLGKMGRKAMMYGSFFNCLFFRKELPMLDDAIARSIQLYEPLGAVWKEHKKTWIFPHGGRMRFRPLETVRDTEKYQGQNLSDVCGEEVGNYATPDPILRMHGALRSAAGIPTQMHLTGNPGGPGQFWIKERYIDPCITGNKILREEFEYEGVTAVRSRVFIPSKLRDNKLLLANDPNYIAGLHMTGSASLVKAWLDGDWNAVEGAYFDCWSERNVIRPFRIPDHWNRIRSFDWGYAAPFSVGWWAVAGEDYIHPDGLIPKGAMVRYREWYGKSSNQNKGIRLEAELIADGILAKESSNERFVDSVADPAIFAEDGGPSHAERMGRINWRKADNKRVARAGAMGGWDQMRARIKGFGGRPMVFCFNTCADSIRTIPALQHDPNRPEDLDTTMEDHAADEWRYGLMSRPWTPTINDQAPKDRWADAFEDEVENSWKTV